MTHGAAITVDGLIHRYGPRTIHDGLGFQVHEGRILGLLGKNGVGKTTLIKILMGFLAPSAGTCRVLGEPSHALSAATKRRIGLVFEGHLAYDFMSIREVERFFSAWYPKWRRDVFHDLIDRLGLPLTHRIRHMSEGQRSQVVLGVVMAQDPDLLILDDYTMGLDAGYRRLFLDYLIHYARAGRKTVLVTSHVVQDMERLVDDVIFLRRGGRVLHTSLADFMATFRHYHLPHEAVPHALPDAGETLHAVEREADGGVSIFAFHDRATVDAALRRQAVDPSALEERAMTLEDAFVGYTGRY
ncbi:ABC transporter ATP-binding protein [Roseospira visakhapatnamensis]|uniref:ABC-2 type transport system ATP-binding protein n=1 Tax=Roseospira visakhapatnamensis TaxID=390880 RepID=A0A7W6WA16_9PROT|nr:ABC transporter ATP-binding protein [Roseospira visakhapatnamensis]MBB4266524.1 ABC-2 type transport system ATP-binding protein [Roseospira visakhapatnamensis]